MNPIWKCGVRGVGSGSTGVDRNLDGGDGGEGRGVQGMSEAGEERASTPPPCSSRTISPHLAVQHTWALVPPAHVLEGDQVLPVVLEGANWDNGKDRERVIQA